MGGELILAAGAVLAGLIGLLGTRWVVAMQRRTAVNEERLSRYESWDRLYENFQAESERFKRQRDEAWAENDRLRAALRQKETPE